MQVDITVSRTYLRYHYQKIVEELRVWPLLLLRDEMRCPDPRDITIPYIRAEAEYKTTSQSTKPTSFPPDPGLCYFITVICYYVRPLRPYPEN